MNTQLFTDEHLAKLRKYLQENATELAINNKIYKMPYYPKKEHFRDYQWLIVNHDRLGRIELYFTGMSSVLKIKGIYVESNRVDSFNFREIHDILEREYNQKLVNDSDQFFSEL